MIVQADYESLQNKVNSGDIELNTAARDLSDELAEFGLVGELTISISVTIKDKRSGEQQAEVKRESSFSFGR